MFYTEGEEIKYEIFPLFKGKRIVIYLKKREDGFVRGNKAFGTHYIEQIFDDTDILLNETIYENPNFVDLNNFNEYDDFD